MRVFSSVKQLLFAFLLFWPATTITVLAAELKEGAAGTSETLVHLMATPDGGVQPRLVNDSKGGLHLLFFKKRLSNPDAREGNLYYRRYDADAGAWGGSVKVSSQAFAMQTFSISRASMAVSDDGRVHVVWYLPRQAEYHYTRSDSTGTRFAAQQSIISTYTEGLDAAADIAASGNNIAIVWGAGALSAEEERSVYGRISLDGGVTFGAEQLLGDKALGACACCSLATEFSADDSLQVAYRSAINGIGRHMQLLTVANSSFNSGNPVGGTNSSGPGPSGRYSEVGEFQQWELSACPLSTNDFYSADDANWLAFENENRTAILAVDANGKYSAAARKVLEPLTETRQKNPIIAVNPKQEKLIVWGEAISHSRGGRLNFASLDAAGNPLELLVQELASRVGMDMDVTIANYSFPAVGVLPNGDFLILH